MELFAECVRTRSAKRAHRDQHLTLVRRRDGGRRDRFERSGSMVPPRAVTIADTFDGSRQEDADSFDRDQPGRPLRSVSYQVGPALRVLPRRVLGYAVMNDAPSMECSAPVRASPSKTGSRALLSKSAISTDTGAREQSAEQRRGAMPATRARDQQAAIITAARQWLPLRPRTQHLDALAVRQPRASPESARSSAPVG